MEFAQAEARARLTLLRARLEEGGGGTQATVAPVATAPAARVPRTAAEKVRLFRQLFRGRLDVYPTRFVSKRTGKPGYAPACANKFVPGVCQLPAVTCSACTKQAFRPVDDAAVLAHLTGQHVMGVYPMLSDETCWLLAADFDKGSWQEDARAFVETARRHRLPALVERSRSGKGAHVWFFFSSPVAASAARKLGCYLITETMAHRHELSMESYDRLFPSQDTMPRGGFGNLIALPLQHGPRQEGNSVFLDEDFVAVPDDQQWAVLASVERIDPATVERIASEATQAGSIVGLPALEGGDEESAAPWTRVPSGKPRPAHPLGPLPERIEAVLAQRLYVPKAGLPASLLNQVKRVAAFQNPEFYKRQAMRLSTARVPRVISCAEDLPLHVALPRGCRPELEALLAGHGIALQVEDQRTPGTSLALRFHGALSSVQAEAARALLAHDDGVFVAPPGVGKTVLGAHLVAARARSTLVLVHRRPLLDQWRAQLSRFLGVEREGIGHLGGGRDALTGRIDVAMVQSLVRQGSVDDRVSSYGHVIVDECHHLPAVSFERVLAEVRARYVLGLTATPQRRDGHHPITQMQLGPVRSMVDARAQSATRAFEHRLIVRETSFQLESPAHRADIQALYAALAKHEQRNAMILEDVLRALGHRRSPILLTERKEQLEYFATRLRRRARHLVVLQGGMGAKELRAIHAQLEAIPPDEERLVLATGRYVGEGFDDARLDTLFLAMPVSWKGTLIQYAGRLHRVHPGKREVQIFDYVDREVPVLRRMFEKRLRGYRAMGYSSSRVPPERGAATADDDEDAYPLLDDGLDLEDP
ncbi:restriction endonuclease subunit R [Aggregicoccus sp. 17bor-14]|nr:DEAD/DEAH box helicase [Simulacricoccus sp. 17bor-14]MRI90496.1 restriction endonuclease subunit R [Aggregicoccus sp. 17bor-14]